MTVTDAYGHSDSWHTDASGYADVYFKSGGYAPGRQITARVGRPAARRRSERPTSSVTASYGPDLVAGSWARVGRC